MSKNKSKKKLARDKSVAADRPTSAAPESPSPYLATAHPPAKNPTLLVVSAVLFLGWFIFLVLAALSK